MVKFTAIMPSAVEPMRADKTALGSIPAAAMQYCEALKTASSYGWYVFPPRDIQLRWDGTQVFFLNGNTWEVLRSVIDSDTAELWTQQAPASLKRSVPPFLSQLFVPGLVQIWTGLTVQTAQDWSVLVRPLANVVTPKSYLCFEGMIESDWFCPLPLFINLKLLATDVVISLPRTQPLFQVQPVPRIAYAHSTHEATNTSLSDLGSQALTDAEWSGFGNTLRSISPERPHDIGRYGVNVRKRTKNEA
jgi:Family of unknown function (DUF6065)